MLILKLILRNIQAHRRKNLIVFSVTGGVCFFLFLFLSFSDGEIENIKNGVSSFFYPYSDIKGVTQNYLHLKEQEESTLEEIIPDTTALKESLREFPFTKEVISQVGRVYADIFTNGKKYLDFQFMPFDSTDATLRSKYRIYEGRDIKEGEKGVMLMHSLIRNNLPINVNDEVTVVGKDFFGQVTSMKFTVIGFYEPFMDNPNLSTMALLPVKDLAVLAGYTGDEANQILIRLVPHAKSAEALDAVRSWAERTGTPIHFYLSSDDKKDDAWTMIYGMIRLIILVMVLITLFITAFGIMNVVSVNMYERRREIGTYFCLGTEAPFLMATYTGEIFFVNFFGALGGIGAGLIARLIVNAMNISSTDAGFQIVMGGSRFTLGLSISTILWIVGGICIITVLTALTTLGKALKVSPVVAVKETE